MRATRPRRRPGRSMPSSIATSVEQRLNERVGPGLRHVFNMTGTIIHTNLGRAQISRAMAQAGVEAAVNPVTLEYDLDQARRGDRDAVIEPMLCALDRRRSRDRRQQQRRRAAAGAEHAGPRQIGARLARRADRNRRQLPPARHHRTLRLPHPRSRHHESHPPARLRRARSTTSTAMLLKVHPSNYRIEGFTRSVTTPTLADTRPRNAASRWSSISAAAR